MGYRIEYDGQQNTAGKGMLQWKTAGKWGGYAFSAFLLVTCTLWPEGREMLGDILFAGDAELTWHALQNLAQQLMEKGDVMEAVSAFCREIISSAAGAI